MSNGLIETFTNLFDFFNDKTIDKEYDPELKLSEHFKLKEFTRTKINKPNVPNEEQVNNLKKLSAKLELLRKKHGAIHIESGFRSPEVNQALKGGGNVQVAKDSLHMQGKAADIQFRSTKGYPITNVQKVFADIAADSKVANLFGEIAVKYNTLHITIPALGKKAFFMYVDNFNNYIRMSTKEVEAFVRKYKGEIKKVGLGLGVVFGISGIVAGIGYLFIRSRNKPRR